MVRSHIQGLDSWERWVESISQEIEDEIKQVVAETAYKVEADAKMLVPVDTGHLRRSIATAFPSGDKGFTAQIGTNVEYALFVEFGTSKQHAKPYLYPAYNKWKVKFKDQIIDITNSIGR